VPPLAKALVGVDIGSIDVKFAAMRKGIARVVAARIPPGLMENGRIANKKGMGKFLKKLRRKALRKNKVRGKDCVVILPDTGTIFRRVTVPAMTAKELRLNLPYEFRDYISGDMDDYIFDYAVENTQTDEEGDIVAFELMAASAERATVYEYADILKRGGFKMKVALPRQIAMRNIIAGHLARGGDPAKVYCVVEIGYYNSRVEIFRGLELGASRVIDIGCYDLDHAIADIYNIDGNAAVEYREKNHEGVLDNEACTPVYGRLSLEIRKAVNFYQYENRDSEISDVYYCGMGAAIPQFLAAAEADTSLHLSDIETMLPSDYGAGHADTRRECVYAVGAALPQDGVRLS
jgi:type IV pilus assembly protein PilM